MRTAAIIASTITVFAVGLLTLIVGGWMVVEVLSGRPGSSGSLTILVAIALVLLGGGCLASALGLAKMRRWARISMQVIGAMLLAGSAIGGLNMLLDPQVGLMNMEGVIGSARPAYTIILSVLAVLGVFCLLIFSSRHVKSQFSA